MKNDSCIENIILRNAHLICDIDQIKDETNLYTQLGYDSLSIVKLIIDIENQYQLEFNTISLNFNTIELVKDIKNLVQKNTNKKVANA